MHEISYEKDYSIPEKYVIEFVLMEWHNCKKSRPYFSFCKEIKWKSKWQDDD